MGRALGTVLDPAELAERYGADRLRYYLLRAIPATEDGDFTPERFVRTCNADLADRLGNLLNRVVSMVGRYYDGEVPASRGENAVDRPLIETARGLRERLEGALARFAPHEALAAIWELVDAANRYVEETAPWALAKQRKAGPESAAAEARLATVLYNLCEALRLIAYACAPFIPSA